MGLLQVIQRLQVLVFPGASFAIVPTPASASTSSFSALEGWAATTNANLSGATVTA